MFIKQITLDGVEGDVTIETGMGTGVEIRWGDEKIILLANADDFKFDNAVQRIGEALCGRTSDGQLNATNSMLDEIRTLLDKMLGAC